MSKKEKMKEKIAVVTTKTLTRVLKADANSTGCCFVYQPKAPKDLSCFRRMKK